MGYSSLSKGSLTGCASTKKIASVFSGDDLKGIKLFTTFGEKDLKVSVKSTGNVTELSKEDPMQYVY
ncbi:MAG: hypothetical protein VW397_09255, partial [Candidatus Margulisiibacteriota bacterium]